MNNYTYTQQVQEIIGYVCTVALTFVAVGSIVALVLRFSSEDELREELADVELEMKKLGGRIYDLGERIPILRKTYLDEMRRLGLTILPPDYEMRKKYPNLHSMYHEYQDMDKRIDQMRGRYFQLAKKRKAIQEKLGIMK